MCRRFRLFQDLSAICLNRHSALNLENRAGLQNQRVTPLLKNCAFMYAVYFILVCKSHAVRKIKSKS